MTPKRSRPVVSGAAKKQNHAADGFTAIITDRHTAAVLLAERVAASDDSEAIGNHEPSFWLRTRLADLHTRRHSGQVERCAHLNGPLLPFAVHAMWAPDRFVCFDCAPTLRLDGDEDRTCDRCSAVVDGIYCDRFIPAGEPVLVLVGLCSSCQRRETAK